MKKWTIVLLLFFLLLVLTVSISGEMISGNKLPDGVRPTIDGQLGDSAWQNAFFIEAKYISADDKKMAKSPTRAWLAYDDYAVYVALEDIKKGEKIIARETKDDNNAIFRDDGLSWSFNGFKTPEGHLNFWTTNPNGAKLAQFSQGVANKPEWRDWIVKVSRTKDGWCAEMQVPWELIELPNREGNFVFWVNFDDRRDGRLAYWKYGGPDNPSGNWAEWQVELKPVPKVDTEKSKKAHQAKILSELFAEKFQKGKPDFSVGATAQRGGFTLTAFPEWKTLEGPIEGLDPVWGERRYKEYRPFFQEGIGVVSPGDFYYSQRIQDVDIGINYTKSTEKFQVATIDTSHRGGKYTANIRSAFLPTKSSSVSGGYLFDRRLQDENSVYYFMAQQRWKPLGINGCFSQSFYNGQEGKNMRADATYYRGNLSSKAMAFTNDSTFVNMLGYGDTGIHGATWDTGWGRAWRNKLMRYAYFSTTLQAINREDNSNFRKTANIYAVLIENHDYGFLVNYEGGNYEEFKSQYSIYMRTGYHFSDSYNNFGVGGTIGRNRDTGYKLIGPYISVRIKGLTTKINSQFFFTKKSRDWQNVVTISYDITKSWAVAARWIVFKANLRDSGSGYIGIRRSQAKGINLFLMLGDPNSQKFAKGGAIKFIVPLY